jgi:hypothetical protein
MSGAMANHAKKLIKKAIQVKWKARICGVFRLNKLIDSALPVDFTLFININFSD